MRGDIPPPTPATDAQIKAIAADYAAIMRAKGHTIGDPEFAMILRMAAINDAWRVAFGRVIR